jgi:hypothetical protein
MRKNCEHLKPLNPNSQKVVNNSQNVCQENEDDNGLECIYCHKIISNKYNKNRHEKKCKKVNSPLECPRCHRNFSDRYSKARHLKHFCKEVSNALIPVQNNIPNIMNVNNNNNPINTQNNNINSNNVNIINFKMDKMDRICFSRGHITQEVIDNLIKESMHHNALEFNKEFTTRYCSKVLEKPENICVEKSNLSNHYSKVHIGDNKWRNALDSTVYPKLASDITEDLYEDMLYNRFQMAISKCLRKSLDNFVNYMADYGYCSDDSKEKEIKGSYNELVDRIKIMISNISLEKQEELKNI